MAESDSPPFPLVALRALANANNRWVALMLDTDPASPDTGSVLRQLFANADFLNAISPLDCVVAPGASVPASDVLACMPHTRVMFALDAVNGGPGARVSALTLQQRGYRVIMTTADAATMRPVSIDRTQVQHDGTTRTHLLALLGLLARDADARELETQLKQDPGLSYHLLRLVNSAAFAPSSPINSFGQAINLLGRRQLQRWLQLLMYARQQQDGRPNPLLPIAALRGAHMEALCQQQGGGRDEQELAFMVGVFSLLDVLLGMTMEEIVGALNLMPAAVSALLKRAGALGQLLRMVESGASGAQLDIAGIDARQWWHSQVQAYAWAIKVSRNL